MAMVTSPCLMTSTGCCDGMDDEPMFFLSVAPKVAFHPPGRLNQFVGEVESGPEIKKVFFLKLIQRQKASVDRPAAGIPKGDN